MTRYDVVCLFYNDSRGWGDDGGARDCERGPQKDVASQLPVQGLNILPIEYA